MNKKIFTLLAGVFLMFVSILTVQAQGSRGAAWNQSRLSLGDSVRTLSLGMNQGYYHLRVDSIISTGGLVNLMDSNKVLYMGKADVQGNRILFVDSLNRARANWASQFSNVNATKAEESAAALWCVNIEEFNQGQNITFDFLNKQHEEMLEVDIYGYESWGKTVGSFDPNDEAEHVGYAVSPGGISGWEFSPTFRTELRSRPLVSYVTPDSVAVLCITPSRANSSKDSVYVKIADARDVQRGLVDGVAYFRLVHAKPFVVSADDYNQVFGTNTASNGGQLKFNEDVTTGYTNPFSQGRLFAEYIADDNFVGKRIKPSVNFNYIGNPGDVPTPGAQNYDTTTYTSGALDSLGYLHFRSGTNNYVHVLNDYFDGNIDGNQFLKIGFKPLATGTNAVDSLMYGQSAFRMVYYPSGDSIYINAYQATYLPTWNPQIQARYGANNWTDSATMALFTFYADTFALQYDTVGNWGSSGPDTLRQMTARLKYGRFATTGFYAPFLYYHKLYVQLQNLTSTGNRALTLFTNSIEDGRTTDHKINTHINFDIYSPCSDGGGRGKLSVAPNVYLIRNTAGQYLQVPLYSATDSAVWVTPTASMDPRYVPSFHWVVEQRYVGSATSPVKITNREFDWLQFDNVQLYEEVGPIRLRNAEFAWNRSDVNARTTTWADRNNNSNGFIPLDARFKNDPLLGYTWIDPDTSVVNVYAFEFNSGIDRQFIGWDGSLTEYPNTDTTLYVNFTDYFDKMYFALDTIGEEGYGALSEYGFKANSTTQIADLVTLRKQAYRLTYKDPFKYNCIRNFSVAPGEDLFYGITSSGYYKEFLGKPVFYLRHVYNSETESPAVALVQRIDSTTTSPSNTQAQTALRNYLNDVYGPVMTAVIMDRLQLSQDSFNLGLFVAQFDEASTKLKMTLRAEASQNVSTFRLVKDEDPLYRRFNTTEEGEGGNDNPVYLHFHEHDNINQVLFENTGYIKEQQAYWANYGRKNFLGIANKAQYPNMETHSSSTIFVDTAYVNRGTGYIKPQYLLAVRPQIVEPGMGCNDLGEAVIPLPGYTEAYYLINAHDSAYTASGTNNDYLWPTSWTRLVFTRAIHANDYLYILGDADLTNADVYGRLQNGVRQFDLTKLHTYALRDDNNIHAINLGVDNKHKDVVFSMRLAERGSDNFYIESETTNRDSVGGPIIAPCEGGWLKEQNGTMVITRSDEVDGINQALLMDVYKAAQGERPTANDDVTTTNVTVVGNAGSVSILNAAGKKVSISNILGQTVAQTVLTSDNETIPVTKGIVIVSIENEETVKTLVK